MTSEFTESLFYPAKLFAFIARLTLSPLCLVQADGITTSDLRVSRQSRSKSTMSMCPTVARMSVGIGMSKAEAIFAYRVEIGSFASLEELMMVRDVGEITLYNNESHIHFV